MNPIADTFGVQFVVLPVVHLTSTKQGVEQAKVAFDAGAHGVFLIDHTRGYQAVADAADAVFAETGGWIGVNALDLTALDSVRWFRQQSCVRGIWVDNGGCDERVAAQPAADAIDAAREGWDGLYFGGTAFKYQRPVTDLVRAGALAAQHMDVVCTSGAATGSAADPDRVRQIACGAGWVPVALASGVDADNVVILAEAGARAFLVASSICTTFDTFDQERTRRLVETVNVLNTK